MISRILCCLGFLIFCNISQAAVTSVIIGGTTASGYDPTDPQNIVIFGGNTGTGAGTGECATPSTNSTCNSCTAITSFCPEAPPYKCAQRSIHPDLILTISLTLDTIPTTPHLEARLEPTSGTTLTLAEAPQTTFFANTAFTIKIKWTELCTRLGLSAQCTNGTVSGASLPIYVGLTDGTNMAAGNYQKFTIKATYQDPTVNSLVPLGTETAPGFFQFSVLPGDHKVFMNDLARGATGPDDPSGVKWQALRVYFAQTAAPPAVPNFCVPITADNYDDLLVADKTTVATSLTTRKVSGLENDVTYMFNIASVDEASVVSGFLKPSSLAASPDGHSATPGEVVGLLDDKSCFIATAAFGSQMAPQVEMLRKFRNQILLPTSWGRKFVSTYYRLSPPVAEFISQHEFLRAGVRFTLWPLIWFAELALQMGVIPALLIAVIAWFVLLKTGQMLRRGPA
jgi:hypothetical protein